MRPKCISLLFFRLRLRLTGFLLFIMYFFCNQAVSYFCIRFVFNNFPLDFLIARDRIKNNRTLNYKYRLPNMRKNGILPRLNNWRVGKIHSRTKPYCTRICRLNAMAFCSVHIYIYIYIYHV